ncbi:MAG: acyl-CoA thioesterase II [Xanthomarina sp.]|uniref:acyl-CoA thioesterase n=1 Tax=Xanthomarina sp. TaxID=1931211 RepID=UPI000C68DD30|nr:acyl-CoA thioesterase II [Xanthomarina sp.]MAL23250.1 acyl-CoA thioesterase II [Xanthomarina sp.]MBF60695.1 acyl-CoA thioesterase II [Xanthomarina sp.]HAB26746.1 acyl-CoA thioesterase II [Xanthomarina gelatinilytica]HAI19538.1 acyl-CoA thioesterase II [Xanthomarina gelatinilytica]|tara:strand:- start:1650 stop:2513 length:864 start_codon:yes stop_codon:yes gene_type:complete
MTSVNDLLDILILEQLSENEFEGTSETVGSPNVFGGQVLAQAINAAYRTITNNRVLHSMHSYFLEAGNLSLPIRYQVSIMRDGGSFSVRRVTASQNGTVIFILSASFHKDEKGYEHQIQMEPNVAQPEDLMSWSDLLEQFGEMLPKKTKTFLEIPRPVEFKPTQIPNPFEKKNLPPYADIWFKLKGDTSSLDLPTKQKILTYISDYNILSVAIQPHASEAHWGNLQTASLDHSMWYFRDFDLDDWLLFSLESPSTSNARGFAKGHIFTRDGKLVASVAQEGLMRPIV